MEAGRDTEELRSLILAAGGSAEQIASTVTRVGPDRVAAILVDELVHRAELGTIPQLAERPITVSFDFSFEGKVFAHAVTSSGTRTEPAPAGEEAPHARVELDLVQVNRAVFGPPGARHGTDRRIHWRDFEDQQALAGNMHVVPVVQHLLSGLEDQPIDLAGLSLRSGSDKWGLHYYTPHYERHFRPLRDRPLTILELGIGGYDDPAAGGGSLRMWKRFFPRALIYGVDVFDKAPLAEQRIVTVRGDQSDPAFLESLVTDIGPVDIIIDDGSHYCPDVTTALRTLFPHLVSGGLYVIEDLQTSYWPAYGGSSERLNEPTTTMGLLKQLLDGLNHEEYEPAGHHEPTEFDRTLTGAHFYHNLAFLEKGRNAEGSLPGWIGRERPA
ncbi:class I SAM-dependent methyltransferase [Amycolatopsis cihanbeyliensis]|uniref:8-demethyl-8-alpha-L-rhamnosyltetracenomycin-C 2'-O-methyltransferase n=1 Tax=Amycolatopsis cihanbeyliensis TaxID=1128664 RepID=A0A542DJF3_AMYCI|nr:class I SAM-dependent methyltransferase [Amycolatopsis cihanbeyliensis]TQJ03196.1 8-demethyl-8-alpha-L-rhamnosyltetracenomycin-C 2'-O-methyltransferase [Amycolatopsis cihanbeyliensis]WCB87243.1 EfrMIV [Amycolatopsis cihanbeyliensis]